MMGRRNASTPIGIDRLEDRLTLSPLGTHPVAHVAHHHAASLAHHHGAQVAHHHGAQVAHHHGAPVGNHPSGPVLPAAGATPPSAGATPPAPVATPPAPGSTPPAPVTTPPDPGPTPPPPGTTQPATALVLSGKIEGPTPLVGTGTIGTLGAVTSSGTLTASGAEPTTYKATVTLVGTSGSITLSLSGQVFGHPRIGGSIDLTYTITGGTGAFQGASGSGKAVLSFEFPAVPGPYPTSGGSVVLSFDSGG